MLVVTNQTTNTITQLINNITAQPKMFNYTYCITAAAGTDLTGTKIPVLCRQENVLSLLGVE
jgi:hypothetical protein